MLARENFCWGKHLLEKEDKILKQISLSPNKTFADKVWAIILNIMKCNTFMKLNVNVTP